MKARAFVASVGARTSIGQTAQQTGFLLRTGVPAIGASPLVDAEDEQVTMSFDPTLDPFLVGDERAAKLAASALEEASDALGDGAEGMSSRLLLCMDQPLTLPGGAPAPPGQARERGQIAPGAVLLRRLQPLADELMPDMEIEPVARGAASMAFALDKGLDALESRKIDLLFVGGAHSDYDPEILAVLGEQGRVFSPKNLDALIPGEAAAFVVLTREDTARRLGLKPSARIAGVGTGVERARHDNDHSAYDTGALISAIRDAAEEVVESQLKAGWSLTDHTFETRRVYEWQTMMTRTHALWGDPYYVESPAQRIGNLGAAALPLLVALAAEGWRRGYAPSGIAIAHAGSDGGERGAILMFTNV